MSQGITPLSLVVDAPASGAIFVAQGTATTISVPFSGHVVNPPAGVTLYYKWYSSLYAPTDANKAALNASDFTRPDGQQGLSAGSHVLTFTAKDQKDDSVAATQNVKYAGMAGGPPQNPQPPPDKQPPPCVIHVFVAQSLWPGGANGGTYTLQRSDATYTSVTDPAYHGLEAAAPSQWKEDAYQALNRIAYVWRFRAGQNIVELRPAAGDLDFLPATGNDPARVRLKGPLPNTLLSNTPYAVNLRVEDINPPHQGHDDPTTATVTVVG